MPRKGHVPHREIDADPVYQSDLVSRVINKVMYDGKKALAQRVVYRAFDLVQEKTGQGALETFEQAVRNVMPVMEVKPHRVGGSTYQVPFEVRPERRMSLALRWLVNYARQRHERGMSERLAGEILEAAQNQGGAVRRKEEVHRMAEANRPFAHYRW